MDSTTIENTIREAAQAIAGTYRIPAHIIEEDLVKAIMPMVLRLQCPHVVQPDPKEGTQYCRLAESVAARLQVLEKAIGAAEGLCLHIVAPSLDNGQKWLALFRKDGEWQTSEAATFGGLILSLPGE